MNREKINKAAEESAIILYRNLSDPDVSEDGRTVSMFMSMFDRGVDWLMQQPLSDRLTDEEKEKIRAMYNRKITYTNEMAKKHAEVALLVAIFGIDLFNKESKDIENS